MICMQVNITASNRLVRQYATLHGEKGKARKMHHNREPRQLAYCGW
jgi:hypothetical protein